MPLAPRIVQIIKGDLTIREVADFAGRLCANPEMAICNLGKVRHGNADLGGYVLQAPILVFHPLRKSHGDKLAYRDNVVKRQTMTMLESLDGLSRAIIPGMGKQKFGKTQIRAWRKAKGFSLAELGKRISMTASNLSKIERGDQPYTQPVLEALARALKVTVYELLSRPPGSSEPLTSELETLSPEDRARALLIIKALKTQNP